MEKPFLKMPLLSILFSLTAQAQSNSVQYSFFDTDSPARTDFVFSQNRKSNFRLNASPNRKKMQSHLIKQLDVEKKSIRRSLKSSWLDLVDRGLNKPQEIVSAESNQVVFSNSQFYRNNRLRIANFLLNPSQTQLLVIFKKDGSYDDFSFLIQNLETQKAETGLLNCRCRPRAFFWLNDHSILHEDETDNLDQLLKMRSLQPDGSLTEETIANYVFQKAFGEFVIIDHLREDKSLIFSNLTGKSKEISNLYGVTIEDYDKNFIYFSKYLNSSYTGQKEFFRIDRNSESISTVSPLPENIVSKFALGDGFGYVTSFGFEKTLHYFHYRESNKVFAWRVPSYVTVNDLYTSDNSNELTIELESDLTKSFKIAWSLLENKTSSEQSIESLALQSDELSLETKFLMIPSFDGTLLPIKIVHQKNLIPKTAPVFMEVYGGFGAPGSIDPYREDMIVEFMKRGGVFVAPGLRGGNELGTAWHLAARRENKIKTYEDLAATAKYLIDSGLTSRDKIVISGTSNGGLTVAATALLFPQYFGLVIAVNGVLDLLGKETLDARFYGWSYEYGNAKNPAEAPLLARISPLELISSAQPGPAFLVVNGRKDSRVNSAHSFKFAKAAEDLKASGVAIDFNLVSINNSGHGINSPENDFIAVRSNLIMWTRIYDQVGLLF